MRYSEYNPWIALIIGIIVLFSGLLKLITDVGGEWHGVYIPVWTGWLFVSLGLLVILLSIRSVRTWKEPEPPAFTDEEVRQAREKLDRMYLREHGAPPQAPENNLPDADATRTAPPAASASPPTARPKPAPLPPKTLTPEEEARAVTAGRKIRQGLLLMLAGAAVFYVAGGALLLIPAFILLLAGLTRLAVGLVERS